MKLLKAFLISLLASTAYAVTMVGQNDSNVTLGYLTVSSFTCSGSPCSSGGGGGPSTSTVLINGTVLNPATTSFNFVPLTGALVTGSSPTVNGVNVSVGPDTSVMASRATASQGIDSTCKCTSASSITYVGAAAGNAILAYADGMPVRVDIDSTTWGSAITLNCGAGGKPVYQNGAITTSSTSPTTSQWVGGTVQTVVYSGALSSWVLQSGATGSSSSGGSGIVSPGTFTWTNNNGVIVSSVTLSTGTAVILNDNTNANPGLIYNNSTDVMTFQSNNNSNAKFLFTPTGNSGLNYLYLVTSNYGLATNQYVGGQDLYSQNYIRMMNGGDNYLIAEFGSSGANLSSNFYGQTVYVPTSQTGISSTTAITPSATYMRILSTGNLVNIGVNSVAIATSTAIDGQIVILESTSNVSDVQISTGAQSGVYGNSSPLLINATKTIEFVFDGILNVWKELHD